MFEENENLVEEETTENAEEQAAEEIVEEDNGKILEESSTEEKVEEEPKEQEKVYTEEEFNNRLDEILAKKIARKEAKIRREYERKYGEAENILKAGLEKDTFEDAVDELKNFYTEKGVQIPKYEPSPREAEILADAEAREIIDSGYDDIVEEVDRLAEIGVDNMTPREKIVFSKLAEYRKSEEERRELASIGVKDDVIDSKEFQEFSSQFTSNTPISKVYELYTKTLDKPKIEKIGSMKNGNSQEEKTYYSPEDVDKLTPEDYDNPVIFKRVHDSMAKWK